jgi:hypothetical protein
MVVNGRQRSGLLAGLVGIGLVVGGSPSRFEWAYAVGDLLALGAAAAWVWYSLAIRPVVGPLGTWQATCSAFVIAALAIAPLTLFEASHYAGWHGVSWRAWGGVIYSAAGGFVVAMALLGASHVPACGPTDHAVRVFGARVGSRHRSNHPRRIDECGSRRRGLCLPYSVSGWRPIPGRLLRRRTSRQRVIPGAPTQSPSFPPLVGQRCFQSRPARPLTPRP